MCQVSSRSWPGESLENQFQIIPIIYPPGSKLGYTKAFADESSGYTVPIKVKTSVLSLSKKSYLQRAPVAQPLLDIQLSVTRLGRIDLLRQLVDFPKKKRDCYTVSKNSRVVNPPIDASVVTRLDISF